MMLSSLDCNSAAKVSITSSMSRQCAIELARYCLKLGKEFISARDCFIKVVRLRKNDVANGFAEVP